MKKLLVMLMLGVCAFAQETTQMIELKAMDPEALRFMVGAFKVNMNTVPGSRFITLTGSKENVAAVEEALKRIDVPKKSIELTFHVLDATAQAGNDKLPADLEPVVKQLKTSFVYQGFRLVDTLQLRTQEGISAQVEGASPASGLLQVFFRSTSISNESKGTSIHIDQLKFRSRLPTNGKDANGYMIYTQTGIETSIDIPSDKKVVVGKANMSGKDGSAYFLIVTAKVVE